MFIFSLLMASILLPIFFGPVPKGDFLFIHDEILYLTKYETLAESSYWNAKDFGVSNGVPLLVNFFERYYYLIGYSWNFNIYDLQKVLYFIKIVLILFIPFIGFDKIAHAFLKKNGSTVAFAATLFYAFNSFTLINWNGSFFLTYLLCYIAAPLTFYAYHEALFGKGTIKHYLLAALGFFIMSFTIYLFATFGLFLLAYTLLYGILKRDILNISKKLLYISVAINNGIVATDI